MGSELSLEEIEEEDEFKKITDTPLTSTEENKMIKGVVKKIGLKSKKSNGKLLIFSENSKLKFSSKYIKDNIQRNVFCFEETELSEISEIVYNSFPMNCIKKNIRRIYYFTSKDFACTQIYIQPKTETELKVFDEKRYIFKFNNFLHVVNRGEGLKGDGLIKYNEEYLNTVFYDNTIEIQTMRNFKWKEFVKFFKIKELEQFTIFNEEVGFLDKFIIKNFMEIALLKFEKFTFKVFEIKELYYCTRFQKIVGYIKGTNQSWEITLDSNYSSRFEFYYFNENALKIFEFFPDSFPFKNYFTYQTLNHNKLDYIKGKYSRDNITVDDLGATFYFSRSIKVDVFDFKVVLHYTNMRIKISYNLKEKEAINVLKPFQESKGSICDFSHLIHSFNIPQYFKTFIMIIEEVYMTNLDELLFSGYLLKEEKHYLFIIYSLGLDSLVIYEKDVLVFATELLKYYIFNQKTKDISFEFN